MSNFIERPAKHNVTPCRHEGELCRGRRGSGLCVAVGIAMVALATSGAPMRVLAGPADQPSESSRAQIAATPTVVVKPNLEVEPAEKTKLFWFVLKGRQDAPPGTHLLIKGLSAGVSLSSGQANSEGAWVVPLSELEELEISVPRSFSGKLNLDAALVDGNGAVLDEHPIELVVKPVAVAVQNGAATDSSSKEVITTGAMRARTAKPEQVIAPSIGVKSAAATRLSKSQQPDGALRQEAGVATPPSPQVQPVAVAATTRPESDAAPRQEATITTAPPPPVKPAAVAAPIRLEDDAASRQEAVVTTAPPSPRPAAPALVVPPVLDAEAAGTTRFAVSVGGRPEDLPPGTYVRVNGLAGGVTLSGGLRISARARRADGANAGWVVPVWALDDLKIRVPSDTSGDLALVVALVDNNGFTLAERSVAVHIKPRVAVTPSDLASPKRTTVAAPALAKAPRRVSRVQGNNLPASSAHKLPLEKPLDTTSDMPGGSSSDRDDLERSQVIDARKAKVGFCLLEWRYFSPRVSWQIGECGDAAGR